MRGHIKKFTFSDHRLAFKVRDTVYHKLAQYDFNKNGLFEEGQIRQALLQILGEDQNEVKYVVKNVFRYDKNRDGLVDYDEFTNFSVEQHFGQMAIQRLHRKGYYSNGSKRIMNMEEFMNTLNYSLGFISCQGTSDEYQQLFREIDLDFDGFISYEDYFHFLKEYFGSKSIAAEQKFTEEKPEKKVPDENVEGAEQRVARLIYSQLKISVMEKDNNRNLKLEKEEIEEILTSVFKLNFLEQTQICDRIMNYSMAVNYEDFMKNMILLYVCELDPKKNISSFEMNESQFVNHAERALHFVNVRPAEQVLRSCFRIADKDSNGIISKNEYIGELKGIFENYTFDKRGMHSRLAYT